MASSLIVVDGLGNTVSTKYEPASAKLPETSGAEYLTISNAMRPESPVFAFAVTGVRDQTSCFTLTTRLTGTVSGTTFDARYES